MSLPETAKAKELQSGALLIRSIKPNLTKINARGSHLISSKCFFFTSSPKTKVQIVKKNNKQPNIFIKA